MATVPLSSLETAVSDTADELLDERHDAVHVELGRVDVDRVLGGLHARGVALVAQPEIGRERVGADVGALRLAAIARERPRRR